MQITSPGRLQRMFVCFVSVIAGLFYAWGYTLIESVQFKNVFFASFILRTVHAFLTATFSVGTVLYLIGGGRHQARMVRQRQPIVYWFSIFAVVHLFPVLRQPALLFTPGAVMFVLSTGVTLYLARGWKAAMNISPEFSNDIN